MLKAFYILSCLLYFTSLAADPQISFDSPLIQGGMVKGKTMSTQLSILGRKIDIDPSSGLFVFGLGRDADARLKITLSQPNGPDVEKTFSVVQREYTTQSIEGIEQKYVSPPANVLDRINSDNRLIRTARERLSDFDAYTMAFKWPAEGPISGVYGSQRIFNGVPKRPHYGLDIAAPVGTPVVAPIDGQVSLVHHDMYYSGGTLIIDHGHGISSTFIHLNKIHVAEGDNIKQGQLIAEIGKTGRVTGPHLDWRINWFDQRLDPQLLVPPR